MEKIINKKEKIFNSPFEISIRTLFILNVFYDSSIDISKLIYLDYFLIHSGDADNGPQSMHPSSPFRAGEIAVKREILKKAIQILHLKKLIKINFGKEGITYKINDFGERFLENQKSEYSRSLMNRANWLSTEFKDMSGDEIKRYTSERIGRFSTDFLNKKEI